MHSSDRNCFIPSQSRADNAFHIPRTVSSTDTCQLTLMRGDCRGFVRGTQEPAGALLADEIGGFAIEEHRAASDEYRVDGVVVAIDHAGQAGVLLDTILGVVIQ